METKKIVNLLNGSENVNSKFATKKWYIIDSEANGNYSQNDEINFLTRSIESSICDYSDAYILVKVILQQHLIMQLHKRYLKIVRHLKNVEQK